MPRHTKSLRGVCQKLLTDGNSDERRHFTDRLQKIFARSVYYCLTHAGVWDDDSQVKRLVVLMREEKGGYARLHITEMRDGQDQ